MNAQLQRNFNKLEADRKALFTELKQYTDELLNKKPAPEAWSVAEVIGHLLTAEEMSLAYLKKKMQDTASAKPEGIKQKWRWLLVQIVFTFDIKFKAPDIVTPKMGFTTLAELDKRWSETRSQTADVLNRLSDKELNSQLWKHAVAGKLNLHHMVAFFGIHFNRHKKQITRTLAAVK